MLFPPLGHTHKNDLSTLDIYSAQIPPVFQTKVLNALGQFKTPWHNEHSKLVKAQNCESQFVMMECTKFPVFQLPTGLKS